MSDPTTLACDMTAIPDEERERHRRVAEHLLTDVDDVEEASNGYRLRLPAEGETIRRAATFVSRERLCCPFFDFTLEVGRESGPVWLSMSGGPGVKEYLDEALVPRLEEARRGRPHTSEVGGRSAGAGRGPRPADGTTDGRAR